MVLQPTINRKLSTGMCACSFVPGFGKAISPSPKSTLLFSWGASGTCLIKHPVACFNFPCLGVQFQFSISVFHSPIPKLLHPLHVGQFVSVICCLPFASEVVEDDHSLYKLRARASTAWTVKAGWGIKCSPHLHHSRDGHKALAFQFLSVYSPN